MKHILFSTLLLLCSLLAFGESLGPKQIYLFPIRESIMPSTAKLTAKCLKEAQERNSDYIIIEMNTYGGLVDAADSIRTAILNSSIPIYVFINNQAASAGALIAIAADKIYMREGGNIGAATVVDQSGAAMPDKYQSFMRSMMRSTAESHGKVEVINGQDTTWQWVRDPYIAEAMVDPSVVVQGLIDSTKVLTFTTQEAIKWGFCEGSVSSVEQVLEQAGIEDYEIYEYKPTSTDRMLGFLTNPAFQGVVIMLIIGGIYFELQSPGIGFPLIVSILAAVLYFAPLYLEGLVANWELIVFIVGLLLIMVELFVLPGFGVAGIAGIVAMVLGLTFAMIDTNMLKYVGSGEISISYILSPLTSVIISVTFSLILSMWLGRRFLSGSSTLRQRVVLTSQMNTEDGYVSHKTNANMVGVKCTTSTALRPAGKVMIQGRTFEAAGDNGQFIEKGVGVTIVRDETGVLYCRITD